MYLPYSGLTPSDMVRIRLRLTGHTVPTSPPYKRTMKKTAIAMK